MKLRELLEALQKAPPEALDQDVLISWPKESGSGCQGMHVVEAVKWKSMCGDIQPWSVVLVSLDLEGLSEDLRPEDDRRMYLSDVSRWKQRRKDRKRDYAG